MLLHQQNSYKSDNPHQFLNSVNKILHHDKSNRLPNHRSSDTSCIAFSHFFINDITRLRSHFHIQIAFTVFMKRPTLKAIGLLHSVQQTHLSRLYDMCKHALHVLHPEGTSLLNITFYIIVYNIQLYWLPFLNIASPVNHSCTTSQFRSAHVPRLTYLGHSERYRPTSELRRALL